MDLNLVQICGRLTAKPELVSLPSGNVLTNITLVTNRSYKTPSGEVEKPSTFHKVVAFGSMAEVMVKYMNKGDEVYIQGRINNRSWDAPDGSKRYSTEVVAEKFEFGRKARANQGQ